MPTFICAGFFVPEFVKRYVIIDLHDRIFPLVIVIIMTSDKLPNQYSFDGIFETVSNNI
jgi:hypothetical protein